MRQPLLARLLMKGRSNFLSRVADDVFLMGCQQAAGSGDGPAGGSSGRFY